MITTEERALRNKPLITVFKSLLFVPVFSKGKLMNTTCPVEFLPCVSPASFAPCVSCTRRVASAGSATFTMARRPWRWG